MPHENRAAGDAERSPAPLSRDDAPRSSVVANIVDTTASELDPAGAAEPLMDADEPVIDEEAADEEALDLGPTFAELGLQPEILRALSDMGYERPMKVQQVVYGDMIAGRDVMVQSRTGSGKTAGFGIPIVQHIASDQRGARALILAPTRELARQVAREIGQLAVHKDLHVEAIYGGAPIKPQMDALAAGAQIIAGTPGRVLDHLRRGTLKPGEIRQLILDECDEMLSMGFQEEIENIIEFLPPKEERQTVLFSATIPDEIQRIARRHLTEPAEHQLSLDGVSVSEIDHYYYVVSGMARTRDLLGVLKAEQPEAAIIFCNTREDTNTVSKFLRSQGYDAEAISSDLVQRDRERVMKRMRDRNLHFLVATDVAARGIDISNLSHVINYTFPESPEVYVHRTGRTGRAGNSGVAISLIGPRELGSFYYLKLIYQIRPEERDLPTSAEMEVLAEGERYERVLSLVDEDAAQEYSSLARRLWQSGHGERVVGALLARLLTGKPGREAASRAEAAERSDSERRRDRDSGRRGSR
ncbi:MAG: DEAD/DEAH box helicase [Haliangiales bacterium]